MTKRNHPQETKQANTGRLRAGKTPFHEPFLRFYWRDLPRDCAEIEKRWVRYADVVINLDW